MFQTLLDNTPFVWAIASVLLTFGLMLFGVHFLRRALGVQVRYAGLPIDAVAVGTISAAGILFGAHDVAQRQLGPAVTLTFRDFLHSEEYEPAGLGLYSYLLFGNSGTTNKAERIAAVTAYLNQFQVSSATRGLADKKQKNGFFLPTIKDAEWIDQCKPTPAAAPASTNGTPKPQSAWTCKYQGKTRIYSDDELAQWIEANYDYARAQNVLSAVQKVGGTVQQIDSIYIVSYTEPLFRGPQIVSSRLLVQDLSRLRPGFMATWVQEVSFQFTKPDYWNVEFLRRTLLIIRTRWPEIANLVLLTGGAVAEESPKSKAQ
jgi:hypothetical protein